MNGIQLKPMPRYKRTEFEEDETSSTSSMPAENLLGVANDGAELGGSGRIPDNGVPGMKSHFGGPVNTPEVRYQGRKRNFWQRSSPFERALMLTVLTLTCGIFFLIIIMSHPCKVKLVQINAITNETAEANKDARRTEVEKDRFCLTPACITVASSIINSMDHSTDPCGDFYQYSCGGWIKSNPLPDGKSVWGTFGKLWQENQVIMKNVLEDETFQPKSKAERKAKIYYDSCMDKNETMEKLGATPMLELLEQVGGWNITSKTSPIWNFQHTHTLEHVGRWNSSEKAPSVWNIQHPHTLEHIGRWNESSSDWNFQYALQVIHNKYNRGGLFSWAVGEDKRNSSRNVIQIDQSGLGLPNRDYYLNKSNDDEVLSAYLSYMTRVGVLLGGEENSTEDQMREVIEFEKKLANITIPSEERQDDEKLYNKMTVEELRAKAPFVDWVTYFNYAFSQIGRNITSQEEVVVYAPEYLENLSKLIVEYLSDSRRKVVLNNYFVWLLVQSMTSSLSKPFRDSSKILRKALVGSEGGDSQWRYCVTDTNNVVGFALGAMFVREVFHAESKVTAEKMIDEIREAFKENLPQLKWMDEETRKLAKEKADAITDMIGFPDFIMNPVELDKKYEGLNVTDTEYFLNNVRVSQFALIKNMKQLDKLVNKTEWEMTPPTVNAYYTATKNNIVFPAGILQAPFYDPNYPKSLNFGAMGVVMGHELTHAFDDEGREYDKEGNLKRWWKNSTIESFQEQTKCFVEQYSGYEVNGQHLNGKQTLGENIADNGGLKAAFHAYEYWINHHDPEMILPGVNLTHRQLFFIGFAQVWCSTSTPEATRLQILNDPHSLGPYRVIGTLSNSVEFSREFKCKANAPMNPTDKCDIW